ncbi:MAG: RNA polymerase sigma factor [Deltaproteobacteria bacterium]|nr:RNA polymerase sigma factor [Deltaproteobacteria bacterium]
MNPPFPPRLSVVRSPDSSEDGPSDDAIMLALQAGDRRALADLARRHQGPVRRFCTAMLLDEQLARDVAQEVFFRIWVRRGSYEPQGKLRAWIFTIARNECRSMNRRRFWRSLLPMSLSAIDPALPADEVLERNSQEALVRAALGRLPEKFRVPLILRFVEELDYEQIAQVIGRTPSAARSRVHYGLEALAELLPPEVKP